MKYQSKYSPNKKVTAAQYITEMICEHKALQTDRELPSQPWSLAATDEWKKYFKNQISSAHFLLKQFPEDAIIRALNRHDARTIYSLRNPYLKVLIKKELKKPIITKSVELGSTTEQPKRFKQKSKLDLLKELE